MPASSRGDVDAVIQDVDFSQTDYQIQLDTSMGGITLDLYPDRAPEHCKNMIGLTKIGFYDGCVFHRVIKGFMIQGGCPEGRGTGGPGYSIDAEFNDTEHVPGTLSMARSTDPNSAGSQFFICTARSPHLDRQYTAFGQTADDDSKAVALSIGEVATASGDRPVEDVTINSAKVIENSK